MGRPKGSKNKSKTPPEPVFAVRTSTPITDAERALYFQTALRKVEALMEEYRVPELDERHLNRLRQLRVAPDLETAQGLAERTPYYVHVWILNQWNKYGPMEAHEIESRARKAENLADYLDKLGQHDNADKQRLRAEQIREDYREWVAKRQREQVTGVKERYGLDLQTGRLVPLDGKVM